MDSQIKILILEHDVNDIDLVKYELKKSFKGFTAEVVQTEKDFLERLTAGKPDIVLSDYSLPSFDGISAFYLKQKIAPTTPFIIVSGTIGEENAIELIKNGVTDYVLKDKLYSLAPKMKRALSEAKAKVEKEAIESALLKSEANMRAIFDNTDVGFLLLNKHFEVLSYNSMSKRWSLELFKINLSENINFRNQLYKETLHEFDAMMTEVLSGKSVCQESSYPDHNGNQMWFSTSAKPMIDVDSKVTGICIAVSDITHRKKAEQEIHQLNEALEERVKERTAELLEANRSLETFSYSVSHDLRSPLRSIMGFTQIIEKQYSKEFSPDLKELFSHIITSTERMNAIIDDLLALAKYGKKKLSLTDIETTQLFQLVWGNISRSINHQAKLQLPELPNINADLSMMEQVLMNLLGNAVKYSSKTAQPVVTVGFEDSSDSITFSISDNGAGFDMQHYNKLFGAFQRLHTTADFEGTGVGLMLVKRIIEKHGGTVWAEGKINAGATFWFSLPK